MADKEESDRTGYLAVYKESIEKCDNILLLIRHTVKAVELRDCTILNPSWWMTKAVKKEHDIIHAELLRRLSAGDAAAAEVARLRKALQEAIALADEGWGYAGEYFREKWGYEQQLAALKAALEEKG